MWQNSPNLGEPGDGEEPGGGSAAGTNFCRHLWARHPNLASAERQLRDLNSQGKKSHNSGSCTQLFKREGGEREGSGKGAAAAGQAAPAPGARWEGSSCPGPASATAARSTLSPARENTRGKQGDAPSRERGEAVPAAPSLAYLQPPVPGAARCPSMPSRSRSPPCPGEARAAAVTWEYRIWYKL